MNDDLTRRIKYHAARLARKVPWVERRELEQEGWLFALRAKYRFNPELGAEFGTFADRGIRGAMLDYLEREWGRKCDLSLDEDSEDANALLRRLLAKDPSPENVLLSNEARAALGMAIAQLPAVSRDILEQRYFAGMKMEEIGAANGYTKGRASQVNTKALLELRGKLDEDNLLDYCRGAIGMFGSGSTGRPPKHAQLPG